jgi:hypothetical protein
LLEINSLFDEGRYRILKHLGEGYCSHVYLAEDLCSIIDVEKQSEEV